MHRVGKYLALLVFYGLMATPRAGLLAQVDTSGSDACLEAAERVLEADGEATVVDTWPVFLVEGTRWRREVEPMADGCVGFLAVVGERIRDLDLYVYSQEGELLASDLRPDAHPYVRLCHSGEAPVILEAHAYGGSGPARVARIAGAPERLASLGALVGECFAGVASRANAAPDLGPEPAAGGLVAPVRNGVRHAFPAPAEVASQPYGELRHAWEARGWTPSFERWVVLESRGFVEVRVPVRGGECEVWGAVVSEEASAGRVDIALRDEAGRRLGWNLRDQPWATVYICAPSPIEARLRVRLRGAAGRVWLARGAR